MAQLLLVKHARPDIDPSVPAPAWHLSDAGRESCARLAAALRPFAPEVLLASPQPKAHETAALVGAALGLDVAVRDELAEHDDTGTPFFGSEAEFAEAVRAFFERPGERVLGRETATEAVARFAGAVHAAVQEHRGKTIALFSHGRVISLYVASRLSSDAFEVWRKLTLPSFVVVDLPSLRPTRVVAPI